MSNSTGCPSINSAKIDQSGFWSKDGIHWDQHRIGWAVAGGCAVLTTFITFYSVMSHAMNYRVPAQQKQVIRILYMPPIFAIIAFFSYRYFREYTYYSVSETLYEAIVVGAFMFLLIESVASTTENGTSEAALLKKDKSKLPFPFCCWRYRPTKAYFMYSMKWSVMQYTIFQPAVSIISVVTEAFNLLCTSSFSPEFANLYLTIISALSNTLAVYGLVVFYELTKRDLKGRRPGAKFWCVNIIVTIPFFQQLLFSILQGSGLVKATKFWTSTNVADGLNALATAVEMVLFSLFMCYAFPVSEYAYVDGPKRHPFKALWDSINIWDFVVETWRSLKFFIDFARNKPGTRSHSNKPRKAGYKGRRMFADVFTIKNIGNKWSRISRMGLRGKRTTSTGGTEDTSTIASEYPEDPVALGQDQISEREMLTAGLHPLDNEKWTARGAEEAV
ncbi:DUF300-domain-containing protein [Hysterangium stoloniferum]|nr:DUF300-domain-containing protein [Hysterangium stoloniferum]